MIAKKTIIAVYICLSVSIQFAFAQVILPNGSDVKNLISLNGTWKFKYIPGTDIGADTAFYKPEFAVEKWNDIKVPGNWEIQGFAEPFYGKNLIKGTGLYRHSFTIPDLWNKQPVYLAFDGVEFGYSIWINGQFAGEFSSAYNREVFDVSPYILAGKINTLAVRVITQPKGFEFDTNDDWSISGISRNVTLFSLPATHIQDVVINTSVSKGPSVEIRAIVDNRGKPITKGKLVFLGELLDAAGNPVQHFQLSSDQLDKSAATMSFAGKFALIKARLWSAEDPYLYTVRLTLKEGNKELQRYSHKVGIREITWAGGVLKLNGAPIKLKGANHHDLSPVNGRAITESEMRKDLQLMRAANINFIRTSHYPPASPFLELCDSLGFYVMNEIPYGFGDQHLKDESYLPLLLKRAQRTIWRDKNHPSVIIWTAGNENPVTDIGLKTGRYIKKLDPTRPYSFPQYPSEFESMLKAIPDSLDLLNDHYPTAEDLNRYSPVLDRPFISGEFAHSLGLDFNSMEEVYETMYANPKMAGGAVWALFDQGILRKAKPLKSADDFTFYAWPDAEHIYDTSTNEGADGIVYANRIPQVDYYQVRKVYSPVRILGDTLPYKSGKNSFEVKLQNRYDFNSLKKVNFKWILYSGAMPVDSGKFSSDCAPHQSMTQTIHTTLPEFSSGSVFYLKIEARDSLQYQFYEKSFQIVKGDPISNTQYLKVNKALKKNKISVDIIKSTDYSFEFSKQTGKFILTNSKGTPLISSGLSARTGRKPTMSEIAAKKKVNPKETHTVWEPYLLTAPEVKVNVMTANRIGVDLKYVPDTPKDCMISGGIEYTLSDSGYVNIDYKLTATGKGEALQTGVSFSIPSSFSEFRWVGKGPYASYPGKSSLDEFGIFHLNGNDLYFPGNRTHVSYALFTNGKGAGFAIVADDSDITVERSAEGITVSHNNSVSGNFNKYLWPKDLFSFEKTKAIEGHFKIIPLSDDNYPDFLKTIFGELNSTVAPFRPFYHSYDQ